MTIYDSAVESTPSSPPNPEGLSWVPDLEGREGPRYRVIADALEGDVSTGDLEPGRRLPTHRDLARHLGVTVGTVSRAYAEAERRGLVRGEVGRGTFVTPSLQEEALGGFELTPRASASGAADLDPALHGADVSILRQGEGEPAVVDLSVNLPVGVGAGEDSAALARLLADFATRPDLASLLEYQPFAGMDRHRAAGAAWTRRRGLEATPERTLVCNGAQHAMAVALATLTQPGDVVLAEALTYPGVKAVANFVHIGLEGVALDENGLRPDAFDAACRRGAKVLYTVPTIQNPTGSVMPEERRREIVEIARRHDVAIIEDDVHGLLPDDPPPALAELAPERTHYIANTSKSIAPGLRIGYLTAPRDMVERLAAGIWSTTWMAPPLMAEIATTWIEDGTGNRFLEQRRRETAARQRLAREILGDRPYEAHPHGYHVWLHMPDPWCAEDLVAHARQRGVLVTSPSAFVVGRTAVPHAVRLCLGSPRTRQELATGLETLVEILDAPPEPCVCIA